MKTIIENRSLILPIILILILFFIILPNAFKIQTRVYKIMRDFYAHQLDYKTKEYLILESDKFCVKYKENEKNTAEMILNVAENMAPVVEKFFAYQPSRKTNLIVYPSMREFNKNFGWEGDKSPMGVYWMGTIGVLSPQVWMADSMTIDKKEVFIKEGPFVHEYTHLIIDYKTQGNYTRWFTEGVAQYIEKEITGYTLPEPSWARKLAFYPFSQLDKNFDLLEDQELAYWQSLIAIEYIVENRGLEVINKIIARLAQGYNMNAALEKESGYTIGEIEEYIKNISYYLPL